MPEISRFLGIVIYMYYKDHAPPHFHAIYGDYETVVYLNDGVVEGKFPRRALKAVVEWYEKHIDELLDNWKLAEAGASLRKIEPLE